MTAVHAASHGPLTRELVDDVLAEFDQWARHAHRQAGAVAREPQAAVRIAFADVRTEIADHLQIRLAATLATYGITPEGTQGA